MKKKQAIGGSAAQKYFIASVTEGEWVRERCTEHMYCTIYLPVWGVMAVIIDPSVWSSFQPLLNKHFSEKTLFYLECRESRAMAHRDKWRLTVDDEKGQGWLTNLLAEPAPGIWCAAITFLVATRHSPMIDNLALTQPLRSFILQKSSKNRCPFHNLMHIHYTCIQSVQKSIAAQWG